jgi:hypothetical protein
MRIPRCRAGSGVMLVAPASLIPLPVNTARDRLARAAPIANRSHEVPTCPLSFRHRQGQARRSGLAEGGLFRHAAAPPKPRYRDVIARRKCCFHAQQKGTTRAAALLLLVRSGRLRLIFDALVITRKQACPSAPDPPSRKASLRVQRWSTRRAARSSPVPAATRRPGAGPLPLRLAWPIGVGDRPNWTVFEPRQGPGKRSRFPFDLLDQASRRRRMGRNAGCGARHVVRLSSP